MCHLFPIQRLCDDAAVRPRFAERAEKSDAKRVKERCAPVCRCASFGFKGVYPVSSVVQLRTDAFQSELGNPVRAAVF